MLELQELGIVSMEQALLDQATGAAQNALQSGFVPGTKKGKDTFWCTMCSVSLGRKAAYRHREWHDRDTQQQLRCNPDALLQLEQTLDTKYGARPTAAHHGSISACFGALPLHNTTSTLLMLKSDSPADLHAVHAKPSNDCLLRTLFIKPSLRAAEAVYLACA
jgi:hypothetical protein